MIDKCPHCIWSNEQDRCTNPDEECHFVPTKECRESAWWAWMHGKDKEETE